MRRVAVQNRLQNYEFGPEPASYGATVENNTLTNVSDAHKLKNPEADRPVGPEKPLKFECGAKGEFTVDGWTIGPTKK